MQFIKQLHGYSGCKVILLKEKNQFVVRKISSSKDYNARLKKQYLIQKHFNKTNIHTPTIFQNGYQKELFFFDMEFIKGKPIAEYISTASIKEISFFIQLITNNVDNKKCAINTQKAFSEKINNLKTAIQPGNNLILEAFKLVESYEWNNIPTSPCHGDLTLENIIITPDNKIYLIDFLDSFYNSWIIDIAKLLQDLEYKWAYRNQIQSKNRDDKLLFAKETLINQVLLMDNGNKILISVYYMLLLNFLRIIPYCKDLRTKIFINNCIKTLLKKLKNSNEEII